MNKIHDELADGLVAVLGGITIGDQPVTAYKWSEGGIRRPAGVVELPTIRRTQPDEAEDHLGAKDWHLVFPCVLYVELGKNPAQAQARLAQGAVDFIGAIDSPPDQLLELSADLKVIESTPFVEPTQSEATVLIGYETHVSVLTFR